MIAFWFGSVGGRRQAIDTDNADRADPGKWWGKEGNGSQNLENICFLRKSKKLGGLGENDFPHRHPDPLLNVKRNTRFFL